LSTDAAPVWFITGCSTGLGRALAERVLQRGYRCVATARDVDQIQAIAAPYPQHALATALDVTNRAQLEHAIAQAESKFGAIDVLVNNAAYGYNSGVEEGEENEVRAMFETNFFALAR
jgi:NADP-dependent 3-hydroxy acid dehydrogenase YdfG